jgi:hypothetical protein
MAHSVGYGHQEDYLSVRIRSFTIYRRSRNPRPSRSMWISMSAMIGRGRRALEVNALRQSGAG